MQTAIYLYKLLIQIVLSIAFNGPSVYAARFRMNADHYVLFRVLPVALQVHPGTSPLVLPSHLPVLLSPLWQRLSIRLLPLVFSLPTSAFYRLAPACF
ncbi:hypothetical protein P692DRAFT_20830236 [Suillus brevipes Sb2]|nr:hypothetical protein P692DRAFT_20830236 [Suillus brevipes Sb2]